VDDPGDVLIAKPVTDGDGLQAPERAELEPVEVPVQQLVRILHVGVTDQVKPAVGHD
jgi:hypothetical protein